METLIWYVLGYAVMPVIFLAGFAVTAVVACFLFNVIGKEEPVD